jgi:hypothetical protein
MSCGNVSIAYYFRVAYRAAKNRSHFGASMKNASPLPSTPQSVIANSQEAFSQVSSAAQETLKVLDAVTSCAYANARTLGEATLRNGNASASLAFDAAQSIARAQTYPEMISLQVLYLQKQAANMNAQAQEYSELVLKFSQELFGPLSAACAKNFSALNVSLLGTGKQSLAA